MSYARQGTGQLLSWNPNTPLSSKYGLGLAGGQPASRDASALPAVAGPSAADVQVGPLHPDSPLFWFGLLAAATFGLMAFSTTVRVGPARLSAGVGKS